MSPLVLEADHWASELLGSGDSYIVSRLVIEPGELYECSVGEQEQVHWTVVEGVGNFKSGETTTIVHPGGTVLPSVVDGHALSNVSRVDPLVVVELKVVRQLSSSQE